MRRRLAVLLFLGGCCSYAPPTPEDLAVARAIPAPAGPAVRWKARLDIESRLMSGKFDIVLAARTGPRPQLRMQCFPDLGPKSLDVAASPNRAVGLLPQLDAGIDSALPGPADPLLFMAISMLEAFAPVTESRVLGACRSGDGLWLELAPVVAGVRVEIFVGPEGHVSRRRFAVPSGARWEEEVGRDGSLAMAMRGFALRVHDITPRTVDSLPDSLFRLELPEGTRPLEPAR